MKIGLEIHVQLRTQTKLFCGCPNKFVDTPNIHVCEYCIGLPGSKPRINSAAIDSALRIATVLNCKIPKDTFFSRKTYFYPDMGKNFQITQYEVPIAGSGFLKIGPQKIKITRINLEEDPARIVHSSAYAHDHDAKEIREIHEMSRASITEAEYTLLDYNRSGVPLCEIVTDPDFTSAREARLFLQELSSILQYLDVYNPDIEGSMRVDANISLGETRVEVKNISGFKDVEKALNYEVIRQKNLLSRNKEVARETRHWDANAGVTRTLRSKEEEDDYGYILEPDIPRLILTKEKLKQVASGIPELAEQKIERYVKDMGIGIDVAVSITSEPDIAVMFEEVSKHVNPKLAANWFAGEIKKTLNYKNLHLRETKLRADHFIKLLKMVQDKMITEQSAELVFREMVVRPEDPELLLHKENVSRIYDENTLAPFVKEAMDENPSTILDFKTGKTEALNFLVGMVMRKTKSRADPDTVRRMLQKMLS